MNAWDRTEIGSTLLQHRIAAGNIETAMCKEQDGTADSFHLAFYTMLAITKPAFLIQEKVAISSEGSRDNCQLGIYRPRQREALKTIVQSVHRYHVPFVLPLNYENKQDFASLTETELSGIVRQYEFAAKWAEEADYDMLLLSFSTGILAQSLSEKNTRTDSYQRKQLRFAKEILHGVSREFSKSICIEWPSVMEDDMREQLWNLFHHHAVAALYVKEKSLLPLLRQHTSLPLITKSAPQEDEITELFAQKLADYVVLEDTLLFDPYFLLKWQKASALPIAKQYPTYIINALNRL